MKSFKLISYMPLLLVFIQSSCKKDNTPTVTNTFSCKIDGKIFKPYASGGLFSSGYPVLSFGNSRTSNGFGISAYNQETTQSVHIEYTFISQTGTYTLRQYPYRGIYSGGYADPGWFPTDSVYTGQLILARCDTINKFYSGTFFFTAKDKTSGRIVQITEGRFDLKE